jgi:hypothetical protein
MHRAIRLVTTPTGFLIVRSVSTGEYGGGRQPSPYAGVDRVPTYPPDDATESPAVDRYVFDERFKSEEWNLIPTVDRALELLRLFPDRPGHYEVLFACHAPGDCSELERRDFRLEHLGYDVALITGDCWSIAADMPPDEWTRPHREATNAVRLFRERADAEAYLHEYVARDEADADVEFHVVYVVRVHPV